MKRRVFLSCAGTGLLSGCLGEKATRILESNDSEAMTRITVETERTIAKERGISVDIEITEASVTETHPASVRIQMTNVDDTARTVQTGSIVPFSGFEPVEGRGLLLLTATDDNRDRLSDCWQLDRPADSDLGGRPVSNDATLDPGESVANEYEVWSHYANDECYPPGVYQFQTRYVSDSWNTPVEWGFKLRVEQ